MLKLRQIITLIIALCLAPNTLAQINASDILSYNQGQNQFQFHKYDNPQAALGPAPRITDTFGGVNTTTPFNNPWQTTDHVSVGLDGHITLQLENFVNITQGTRHLGIFTFQQFLRNGSGTTTSEPTLFYPNMQATLHVSEDGYNWVPINNNQLINFDLPANAYSFNFDESDYGKPTNLNPQDLTNKSLLDLITLYDNSAGGTWIDLTQTGLSKVGYIRLQTLEDQPFSFQLESISINRDLIGSPVPSLLIGDAQGDEIVDYHDLELVKNYFGQTLAPGDVTFDGITNLNDLATIRNQYGQSTTIVPEPLTLSLISLTLLQLTLKRKSNR